MFTQCCTVQYTVYKEIYSPNQGRRLQIRCRVVADKTLPRPALHNIIIFFSAPPPSPRIGPGPRASIFWTEFNKIKIYFPWFSSSSASTEKSRFSWYCTSTSTRLEYKTGDSRRAIFSWMRAMLRRWKKHVTKWKKIRGFIVKGTVTHSMLKRRF